MTHLPKQWTVGCGALNGQKVIRTDDVIAYAAECVAAERERCANIAKRYAVLASQMGDREKERTAASILQGIVET